MPSLSECPVELLLDNLLPELAIRDLMALSATSRFFAMLAADDTFWKRKLEQDFNFSRSRTARTTGWKFLYQGLSKPKVFVWGESDQGRLGLTKPPKAIVGRVPWPLQLGVPGRRIVDLIAGGWSFHALDSEGHLFVWGTIDGTSFALNSDGFSVSNKTAFTPLKLNLGNVQIRSVSCGRLHSMALDGQGQIWTFLNWGRPFRTVSHLLDRSSPDATPAQIECGWSFSSVLTESGDVLVWWPHGAAMYEAHEAKMHEMNTCGDKYAREVDGVIPCVTWDFAHAPSRLPPIPRLPSLKREQIEETCLVRIAAMDNFLVGLTNEGHVLKFDKLESEEELAQGRWTYLPHFSDIEHLSGHAEFSPSEGEKRAKVTLPEDLHITHISAHFRTFVAYSTGRESVVLMGDTESTGDTPARIIPELQHRGVISVVLGDYHFGALTSDGKLLTWGAFSQGALGLGDPGVLTPGTPGAFRTEREREMAANNWRNKPADVVVPTEVRFDHGLKHKKERFCFAAAAAGWHMGALVIDLEDSDEEKDETVEDPGPSSAIPGHYNPLPQPPYTNQGPGQVPIIPMLGRGSPFRVGFAGRGFYRGHAPRGRGNEY